MTSSIKCGRCYNDEKNLPTHQYIKFGVVRYDLCTQCWTIFNEWLYGRALKEPKPDSGRIYSPDIIAGNEPSKSLVTGREPGKKMEFRLVVARNLEIWLSTTKGNALERKIE